MKRAAGGGACCAGTLVPSSVEDTAGRTQRWDRINGGPAPSSRRPVVPAPARVALAARQSDPTARTSASPLSARSASTGPACGTHCRANRTHSSTRRLPFPDRAPTARPQQTQLGHLLRLRHQEDRTQPFAVPLRVQQRSRAVSRCCTNPDTILRDQRLEPLVVPVFLGIEDLRAGRRPQPMSPGRCVRKT